MDGNGHVTARQLAARMGEWRGSASMAGYVALADRIRLLVLDGRLPTGVRLPAERELAVTLPVSRGTVAAAYDRLRDLGFAHRRRGSGSYTALPAAARVTGPTTPFAPRETGSVVDLSHTAPAAPSDAVHAATLRAVELLPTHLAGPGYDLLGLPVLRQAVADRLCARGLRTHPDQVMITNGAQHGFMLVLRALTGPGDRILVEHPTYPNALDAVERGAARPVPVPLSDDGWDLDLLAATLRQATPRLAYLVPDFQNPTGHQMPVSQRATVVDLARRSATPLIIDDTVAELQLEGSPPVPMGSFGVDSDAPVITLGSASKTFWGGLRIGWIRAPRTVLRRIATARASVDLSTPVLEQLIAADLLARTDDVLPAQLTLLRRNRDHLLANLAAELPAWRTRPPHGGLSLWIQLGAPASSALVQAAASRDLHLAAGPRFGTNGAFESALRLPYVHPPHVLDDAVGRLRAAWHALSHSTPEEDITTPPVI